MDGICRSPFHVTKSIAGGFCYWLTRLAAPPVSKKPLRPRDSAASVVAMRRTVTALVTTALLMGGALIAPSAAHAVNPCSEPGISQMKKCKTMTVNGITGRGCCKKKSSGNVKCCVIDPDTGQKLCKTKKK